MGSSLRCFLRSLPLLGEEDAGPPPTESLSAVCRADPP